MKTVQRARVEMTRRRKRYPPLTRGQQKLVEEHHWIAGRLAHSAKCLTGGQTGCLTRDDLESVALFALCVAATRYDPSMGYKYSTYAWNTARGYIQHALRDTSRMVRTPRWVGAHKKQVDALIKTGKSYVEIAEELGIAIDRVAMCDESTYNYHISYDSRPEDWMTKEFIFEDDEAKAALISKSLISRMKEMSDAEMRIMERFVEEKPMSDEEREWASDRFYELQAVAHGLVQDGP